MQQCPQVGFVVKLGQRAKHVPAPNAITLSSIGLVAGDSVQIVWWSNQFPWSTVIKSDVTSINQPWHAMTIHDPSHFTRNGLRSFKRGVQRREISKWPVEVQQALSGLQSLSHNTGCLQATCVFLQSTLFSYTHQFKLNYTCHSLLSLHNRPIGFHYLSVSALIGTPCWGVPTPSTAARSSQIGRGKKFWGIGLSRWANLSHSRVWSCQ